MLNQKIKKHLSTIVAATMMSGVVATKKVDAEQNTNNDTDDKSIANKKSLATKTGKVMSTALNVRSGASTNYSVLGTLLEGESVEIVSTASNGWYKIKYKNSYGYVNHSYIGDFSNIKDSTPQVISTGIVSEDALSVRDNNSTSSEYLGCLYKGDKVQIVEKMSNNWYKIKYNNDYAYVKGEYISFNKNLTLTKPVLKIGTIDNTTTLNVRKGPSTNYETLGILSKGSQVEIVDTTSYSGWYQIKYGSEYAYINSRYINSGNKPYSSKSTTSSIKTSPNTTTSSKANITSTKRTNLNNFLFIGDSFTVGISNVIKSQNSKVYVHAKSGSRPSYWLDKVDSMPSNSSVEGICLLIGVNGASTSENITDTKILINKLVNKYPNKTIYVQKVFPVAKTFTGANPDKFNASIRNFNNQIQAFCSSKSNVKFINTTTGFVDNNGYLLHSYDGLHISSSKSGIFYNNILNAIKMQSSK